MSTYDHKKIEKKWQKKWAKDKLYKTPDKAKGEKDNFYLLVEFPYPSGNLHVGHWYAFAVPDILARCYRMQGKNVLYPIGFDAFGLPAENAAIKNKLNPRTWTLNNIEYMKTQIRSMGTSFDWSREVVTCDPAYYKWTQWLFLQFFKNGLVYRKETAVNWCPKDKTVLANEQVVGGKCERCESEVVQRKMLQWNIKITDYADRLIDDLDTLDWPKEIKDSQRNWIGRSEGAEIDFPLAIGNQKKLKYVLLHGYRSNPDNPRWQWIKAELEAMGHEVVIPILPNTNHPKEHEQVDAALAATTYDENTVLVGHSLGGLVAMKVAERLTSKISRLVIIGSAMHPSYPGYIDRPFQKDFDWNLDLKKIKASAPERIVLSDIQEVTRAPYLKDLAKDLDAELVETKAVKEHYVADREPDMLMCIHPTVRVFTTRADTLFGATYLVLAPEHSLVTELCANESCTNRAEVEAYVGQAKKKTELERMADQKEKTGVELKGVKAINPSTGEQVPVYIADYVLGHYGTGAIMAVPAHDERDYEFAKKYDITIKEVLEPLFVQKTERDAVGPIEDLTERIHGETLFTGKGILRDSGEFSGLTSEESSSKIVERFGRMKTTYKLRDWIVSRQRYWGVPIPIIHCTSCGPVAVKDKDLPVKLPVVKDYLPEGSGKSPLAKVKLFVNVKCPQCKGKAERETDTLDTFVDSSWYFLRYIDPKNKTRFADAKKLEKWMPVDLYSGGAEHTTMHVLYSRFWQKAMYDLGLVKDNEPYKRRMNRSLIMGPDGQKMSKSRGNVIDPDEVVVRLGADTVRMYLAFIGPYNEVSNYPWNPDGVVGVRRFLERVWRAQSTVKKADVHSLSGLLHKTIKKVGEDIAALKFNTAISQLMIFLNALEKEKEIGNDQWRRFLRLLSPFAPHTAEELWELSGHKKSIHLEAWPEFDAARLKGDTVTIVVQINGKTRGTVDVAAWADQGALEAAAHACVAARLGDKKVLRAVVVPGRLVNFVIEE